MGILHSFKELGSFMLYSSPCLPQVIKLKNLQWNDVAQMGEMKNLCWMFMENPLEKLLLSRLKSTWMENLKIFLREIIWKDLSWMVQDLPWADQKIPSLYGTWKICYWSYLESAWYPNWSHPLGFHTKILCAYFAYSIYAMWFILSNYVERKGVGYDHMRESQ